MPSEVHFPQYRDYLAARQDANNAMMALLAGSRLAVNTLALTEGSSKLLPEMFPQVQHIERFNLKTEDARSLLQSADKHLAIVAVPYALAVHEHLVLSCLDWVEPFSRTGGFNGGHKKAWVMHKTLFDAVGAPLPVVELQVHDVIREMRNSQIHRGGLADNRLLDKISALSPDARALWLEVTGEAASQIVIDGKVQFDTGHIVCAFSITKRLGRSINTALQMQIDPEEWAKVIALDFGATAARKKLPNSDQWRRSLIGYASHNYKALDLGEDDLEQGARQAQLWTRPVN